ncbi:MAG: hypothetical protein FWE34_06665 [Defluviitaleaceae bacterium]|nr:hypothetical protein [Defluviitaleaceae bacterium]
MRKGVYYGAGILCLAISAMLLLHANILPLNIANNISQIKFENGYKNYYHIGFPMPKNDLRQGTVYLPVYSEREREHLWDIMLPFSMDDAEITETNEYFEATAEGETLRIYRYLDLLEYENANEGKISDLIEEDTAKKIAKDFLEEILLHKKPYDVTAEHNGDNWIIEFAGELGGLPNRAFPTIITLDNYGNVTEASHFFFEYEALDIIDMITMRIALSQLPREDADEGKVHLKGYELVYGFEDSVLVPMYRFYGGYAGGREFDEMVGALRFY